ncbi:MAG: tetratricopeptide repeat protein [Myxococcales bacterium]|nr:tetratricopeptide repeat protein [Myxococcales bacterium]
MLQDVGRARLMRKMFNRADVRRFGRYAVVRELGRGGMGVVLEAFDDQLGRPVALKLLHPHAQRESTRLRREAQALARLSHPNVVQVFEAGEHEGRPFVALELVPGPTLEQWQSQTPRPGWRRCVEVYIGAGRGLAAAHQAGLIHRDFKPSNCIIDDGGRARVLDFGLVAREESATTERYPVVDDVTMEPREDALGSSLTRTGTTMGTIAYMPLEQLEGRQTGPRSDQFCFCVSLYEALHGERPFPGHTAEALAASLAAGVVRSPPPGVRIPRRLRAILRRGLATNPAERWPSMLALVAALEAVIAPRRSGWWKAGLAALGGTAAIFLVWPTEPAPCTGPDPLAGIWDDDRRDAVEAAFGRTALPYAGPAWSRIAPILDDYAADWSAAHAQACEATRVHQVQTEADMGLRMGCLAERRTALREVVDVLSHVDASTLEQSSQVPATLPSLARCDDLPALHARLPPPEDPARAQAVDEARSALVEIRVQREAGQLEHALTRSEAAVTDAEALGYEPLLAEALIERGEAREALGRYEPAEGDLERAYLVALHHDHTEALAQAARSLLWVVGHRRGLHDEGHRWGRTALALAERPDADPRLEAEVLGQLGILLRDQGRMGEAREHLEHALTLRETVLGPYHASVASTTHELGNTLLLDGQPAAAQVHYERTLALQARALGQSHPALARTRGSMGTALLEQGQPQAALEHYQEALAIQTEALPPAHVEIGMTLGNIGRALEAMGQLDEALPFHQRALDILERALDPAHPDVTRARGNVALVLQRQGRLDEALVHSRRVLADFQASLGPRHPAVGQALDNIGTLLEEQTQLDTALLHYRQALGIYRATLDPQHPLLANVWGNIGSVQLERGALPEAREAFERALALARASQADPGLAIPPLVGLARLEHRQGDLEVAFEHAREAIAVGEANQASYPDELEHARALLAQGVTP